MDRYWILLANTSTARLYKRQFVRENMELIETIDHPNSRLSNKQLVSDRPGQYVGRGVAHGVFMPPTFPKYHEAENFAKQIADRIGGAKNQHLFENLIVFAAPKFLGMFLKNVAKPVRQSISISIAKDYLYLDDLTLQETVQQHLIQQVRRYPRLNRSGIGKRRAHEM